MYKDYPYLYETHLHTSQSSACAQNTGYEMAKAAHEWGYAGIIVTDHHFGGNTAADRSLPWEAWVKEFCKGYYDAKRYADDHDFDVFFGYEAGFDATEFLIYGITPEWMAAHPELRDASPREHFRLVHEAGGIVVHAHPYREVWYIKETRLWPDLVDGVEGINGAHSSSRSACHNRREFDVRAQAYAREHQLPMTAGSDIHTTHLFGAGIAFKRRLESVQDFCQAFLGGEDYILTNGDSWFDAHCCPLND